MKSPGKLMMRMSDEGINMADAMNSNYLELYQKALDTDAQFAKFRACRKCMDRTEHEHVRVGGSEVWRCKRCKTEWNK